MDRLRCTKWDIVGALLNQTARGCHAVAGCTVPQAAAAARVPSGCGTPQ